MKQLQQIPVIDLILNVPAKNQSLSPPIIQKKGLTKPVTFNPLVNQNKLVNFSGGFKIPQSVMEEKRAMYDTNHIAVPIINQADDRLLTQQEIFQGLCLNPQKMVDAIAQKQRIVEGILLHDQPIVQSKLYESQLRVMQSERNQIQSHLNAKAQPRAKESQIVEDSFENQLQSIQNEIDKHNKRLNQIQQEVIVEDQDGDGSVWEKIRLLKEYRQDLKQEQKKSNEEYQEGRKKQQIKKKSTSQHQKSTVEKIRIVDPTVQAMIDQHKQNLQNQRIMDNKVKQVEDIQNHSPIRQLYQHKFEEYKYDKQIDLTAQSKNDGSLIPYHKYMGEKKSIKQTNSQANQSIERVSKRPILKIQSLKDFNLIKSVNLSIDHQEGITRNALHEPQSQGDQNIVSKTEVFFSKAPRGNLFDQKKQSEAKKLTFQVKLHDQLGLFQSQINQFSDDENLKQTIHNGNGNVSPHEQNHSIDQGDLRMMKVDYDGYARRMIKLKKAKRQITIPQGPQFNKKHQKQSIRQTKVQEMVDAIKWEEDYQLQNKFKAKPIPSNINIPLYQLLQQQEKQRRTELKTQAIALTKMRENPFSFYEKDALKIQIKKEQQIERDAVMQSKQTFTAKAIPSDFLIDKLKQKDLKDKKRREDLKVKRNKELTSTEMPIRFQEQEIKRKEKLEQQKNLKPSDLDPECLFNPKIKKNVPNHGEQQKKFSEKLAIQKQENQKGLTQPQPFKAQSNSQSQKTSLTPAYLDQDNINNRVPEQILQKNIKKIVAKENSNQDKYQQENVQDDKKKEQQTMINNKKNMVQERIISNKDKSQLEYEDDQDQQDNEYQDLAKSSKKMDQDSIPFKKSKNQQQPLVNYDDAQDENDQDENVQDENDQESQEDGIQGFISQDDKYQQKEQQKMINNERKIDQDKMITNFNKSQQEYEDDKQQQDNEYQDQDFNDEGEPELQNQDNIPFKDASSKKMDQDKIAFKNSINQQQSLVNQDDVQDENDQELQEDGPQAFISQDDKYQQKEQQKVNSERKIDQKKIITNFKDKREPELQNQDNIPLKVPSSKKMNQDNIPFKNSKNQQQLLVNQDDVQDENDQELQEDGPQAFISQNDKYQQKEQQKINNEKMTQPKIKEQNILAQGNEKDKRMKPKTLSSADREQVRLQEERDLKKQDILKVQAKLGPDYNQKMQEMQEKLNKRDLMGSKKLHGSSNLDKYRLMVKDEANFQDQNL